MNKEQKDGSWNSGEFCPYCMGSVRPGEPCPACGLTQSSYTPAPHHLPPGTVLMDRYLIGRALGEGGFGITYIGRDLRLEVKVAIKGILPLRPRGSGRRRVYGRARLHGQGQSRL